MRRGGLRLGEAGEQVEGGGAFGAAVDGGGGAGLADAAGRRTAVAGLVEMLALELGEGDQVDQLVDGELAGQLGGCALETKREPEQGQAFGIVSEPFFASATVGGGAISVSERRITTAASSSSSACSSATLNSGLPCASSARRISV